MSKQKLYVSCMLAANHIDSSCHGTGTGDGMPSDLVRVDMSTSGSGSGYRCPSDGGLIWWSYKYLQVTKPGVHKCRHSRCR